MPLARTARHLEARMVSRALTTAIIGHPHTLSRITDFTGRGVGPTSAVLGGGDRRDLPGSPRHVTQSWSPAKLKVCLAGSSQAWTDRKSRRIPPIPTAGFLQQPEHRKRAWASVARRLAAFITCHIPARQRQR